MIGIRGAELITTEEQIAIAGAAGGVVGLNQQIIEAIAVDIAQIDQAAAEIIRGFSGGDDVGGGQNGHILIEAQRVVAVAGARIEHVHQAATTALAGTDDQLIAVAVGEISEAEAAAEAAVAEGVERIGAVVGAALEAVDAGRCQHLVAQTGDIGVAVEHHHRADGGGLNGLVVLHGGPRHLGHHLVLECGQEVFLLAAQVVGRKPGDNGVKGAVNPLGCIGASPQLQLVEEAAAQFGLGIEIECVECIRDGLGTGVNHRPHHPRGGDGQIAAAGDRHGGAQLGAPPAGGAAVACLRNGDGAAAAEDRIAQWRGVGTAPAAGVGAGVVGVQRSDRLGGVLRIAGIERAQIVGSPDEQRAGCAAAAALEGDRRPEAGRRGDVGEGFGVTGPQHGDGRAEVAGIGEIEDRLAGAAGEVVLDPAAVDDHHSATAVGLRCRDHQIVGAIVVDISHQHVVAEVLAPASAGIGLDQQAAEAALIERRIEQRQVGPVGREVGSGQGVEPGDGGLGWIADRAAQLVALAVGAAGERAGEIDPHTTGRIADGIAGAGLGDRQPAAVGAAVCVGEGAIHLGVAEAAGRCRIAGRVLAAQLHAAVDVLQLQRRCLQHIGGGQGLAVGDAVGFQRGGQAGAEAQGHDGAGALAAAGVAEAGAVSELQLDAGAVGDCRIKVIAVACATGLAADQ